MTGRAGSTLPIVLAVTAVLALVFLTTLEAVHGLRSEARRASDQVRLQVDALTLEAQFTFLAATGVGDRRSLIITPPPSRDDEDDMGPDLPYALRDDLDRLFLDGHPYRAQVGQRNYILSVQDGAGLINVNALDDFQTRAMLELLGVDEADRGRLSDRIADYIDPDDLVRPQGAEREDYRRAGLSGPLDRPLLQAEQLFGVMGFAEAVDARTWREHKHLIAPDPTWVLANVNTAPPEVLRVLYGLSETQARQVVLSRQDAAFGTIEDFLSAVGGAPNIDLSREDTLPNLRYHVRIVDPRSRQVVSFRLTATSTSGERPLWVEDRAIGPASAADIASDSASDRFIAP